MNRAQRGANHLELENHSNDNMTTISYGNSLALYLYHVSSWSLNYPGIDRREQTVELLEPPIFVILMFLPLFATRHQNGFHHGQMTNRVYNLYKYNDNL